MLDQRFVDLFNSGHNTTLKNEKSMLVDLYGKIIRQKRFIKRLHLLNAL
jgi:hypothetical protein